MSSTITANNRFQRLYSALANDVSCASEATLLLSLLIEQVPTLVSLMTDCGELIFASPAHATLKGVDVNFACDGPEPLLLSALFPGHIREKLLALPIQDPLDCTTQRIFLEHNSGREKPYLVKKTALCLNGKSCTLLMINAEDMQELGEGVKHGDIVSANHYEFHDAMTGIANRNLFYDRLAKTLSKAKRNNIRFALLFIDLDQFKNFNEQHGREIGDRFLQHVAKHFLSAVRDTDTVARMGGDEFIVLLDDIDKTKDIDVIAQKLSASDSLTLQLEGSSYSCSVSMGISLFPKDGVLGDELLRNADQAMTKAKRSNNNEPQFFIEDISYATANYLLLENDLHTAINNQEIKLYYQPQINIFTGQICGVEVLCRWQHSSRGLLPPAHFIPLAEDTGIIEVLGRQVLQESCTTFSAWLARGIDLGKLSVNVSARQFRNVAFKELVCGVLQESGLAYHRLELELTETSTMENTARSIDVLTDLRRLGVSIALDDFGTGYSSLSYLRRFPIQKLKIDKSFIDNVDRDKNDGATVKSIIDLAHNMSLEVIAEGVERLEQVHWLRDKGCEEVQGYFYSKPLCASGMLELIDDSSRTAYKDGLRFLVSDSIRHN